MFQHRGLSRDRVLSAVCGVIALFGGLAAGGLVAALLGVNGPFTNLGNGFISITPEWLKELAISAFGTHDKDALRVGMLIVVVVLSALIGLLTVRRPRPGFTVAVLLALVIVVVGQTRPDHGPATLVASVLTGAVGLMLLSMLTRRLRDESGTHAAGTAAQDRRHVLKLAGGLAVGSGLVGLLSRFAGSRRSQVTTEVGELTQPGRLPQPSAAQRAVPARVQATGAVPWQTQATDFYRIDTAFSVPRVAAATWTLNVHGMVDRPLRLTFDQLIARTPEFRWTTLCCVSNEVGGDLIGNALWSGTLVKDLLAEAGIQAGADAVLSKSKDGWTAGTPLQALTDDRGAMLAWGMNGAPLPIEHGFPVRMVVPGLYGYVSATKWIVDMEVTQFSKFSAYWTDRGWSAQGPIKLASRIDTPSSSTHAGTVAVAGVAWHQNVGISGVELQIDGGPWERATLMADGGIDCWRQWTYAWNAPKGKHRLTVRALDKDGTPQTAVRADPAPNGASGLHSVTVSVS